VQTRTFAVRRIIDGDTFVIRYDGEPTSVRILGIDTPERGEPGFIEARERLARQIEGRVVRLSFDGPRKRDAFGRLLATVSVDGRPIDMTPWRTDP
jgi:micrococcal nuclease